MPKHSKLGKVRRQDKYYNLAKDTGYRARSAFKLVQLNKRYDFLSSANVVIDLCAAPGGWSQVAASTCPMGSTIIATDLVPIRPIRGVITHQVDITTPRCRTLIRRDLGTRRADVVLHDGAPNVGKAWLQDAYTQAELVLHSLRLATEFLREGGLFITKVFRSRDYNALLWVFQQLFEHVHATKPHSSRTVSAEIFVVCKGYKNPHKLDARLLDPRHVFAEIDGTSSEAVAAAVAASGSKYRRDVADRYLGPKTGLEVDVMHKKDKSRRKRTGYSDTAGALVRRIVPVEALIYTHDASRVLGTATEIDLHASPMSEWIAELPETTESIRDALSDLKVLGRSDFKSILKWRLAVLSKFRRDPPRARADWESEDDMLLRLNQIDAKNEERNKGEEDSDSSIDSEDEDALPRDLSLALKLDRARRKRDRRRAAKMRAKAITRRTYGMHHQSIEPLDDEQGLFSLAKIRKLGPQVEEAIRSGEASEEAIEKAVREAGADNVLNAIASDDSASDDSDDESGNDSDASSGDDEEAARLKELEAEIDTQYAVYLSKQLQRDQEIAELEARGLISKGKRMTRRERMAVEANLKLAQQEAKLDAQHQRYLDLLASAREKKRNEENPDAESDSPSSDSSSDDDDEEAREEEAAIRADMKRQDPTSLRAQRWFSAPLFAQVDQDADEDDLDEIPKAGTKRRAHFDDEEEEDEDDDDFEEEEDDDEEDDFEEEDDEEEEEEEEEGAENTQKDDDDDDDDDLSSDGGNIVPALLRKRLMEMGGETAIEEDLADAKKTMAFDSEEEGKGSEDDEEEEEGDGDSDEGSLPDYLRDLPKSDREKRKDKLRKERERRERKEMRQLQKEGKGPMEVIPTEDGGTKMTKAQKDLLRAGVGRGGTMKIPGAALNPVPLPGAGILKNRSGGRQAEADDSDDDSTDEEDEEDIPDEEVADEVGMDPRDEDYDSDTHAQMLALAKKMRKHSRAKDLLDAAYNRYAFDDDALPTWFAEDEARHFKPQLPITRADVEKIKEEFRAISARPIHKVAEARNRKKKRAAVKMVKARAEANAAADDPELTERARQKAIARALGRAQVKRPRSVIAIVGKGPLNKAAKGAKVKLVDRRMLADRRGEDRKTKGKGSRQRSKTSHKRRRK